MITREALDPTGWRIERMWRQGAPRRVAELETAGAFYELILSLQKQEEETYGSLVERGVPPDMAREQSRAASSPPDERQL
jgi:hypothetical protein